MWHCRQCTFENKPSCVECEVCGCSAHDLTLRWQCPHCCQFNPLQSTACRVCDRLKSSLQQAERDFNCKKEEKSDLGILSARQEGNSSERSDQAEPTTCASKQAEHEPQPDDWICQLPAAGEGGSLCHKVNRADCYRCSACNGVKPYLPHQLVTSQSLEHVAGGTDAGPDQVTDQEHGQSTVTERVAAKSAELLASAMSLFPSSSLVVESNVDPWDFQVLNDQLGQEESVGFPDRECRLVLVGKTGNGKSCLGNTLLGLERFSVSSGFASNTLKCQRHSNRRFGVHLEVVDTPGLFDTSLNQQDAGLEICKCVGLLAPGPHAVILVVRIGVRFTEEENRAVTRVRELFGAQLLRFLVVAFTHGDTLSGRGQGSQGEGLQELLDSAPTELQDLIRHTNGRYVVFNNKAGRADKDAQVRKLLLMIKNLMKVNGGGHFSSALLEKVEQRMVERETQLAAQVHPSRRGRRRAPPSQEVMQYRDMAREEIVLEQPLLDRIKHDVWPQLYPVLTSLASILFSNAIKFVARTGRCIIQ